MSLQISESQSNAIAPANGAPSVCPCPQKLTIKDFSDAAAQPGDSAMQIAAREALVKHFYMNTPGLMSPNVPDTKQTRSIMFEQQAKGIDFTKPVKIIEMPPPERLVQHVRKDSGNVGQFFDPIGDQKGTAIGLNTDPNLRETKTFDISELENQRITALQSTAAPIVDNWTDRTNPVVCRGGGDQVFVPHNAIDRIKNPGKKSR
jgi:hypothetical protein